MRKALREISGTWVEIIFFLRNMPSEKAGTE
jgi:hypothetical protein